MVPMWKSPPRCPDTGRDQARLARNGQADRLDRDEEDAQAVGGDELCHRIVTTSRVRSCPTCVPTAKRSPTTRTAGMTPDEPETPDRSRAMKTS